MPYPPADPASNKADGTATPTDHPAHHNELALAVAAIVDELGAGPKGAAADLTARLTALDTTVAAKQPLDGDLTAIAALTTTAFGRAFLELANAGAGRTALGLGTAATSASGDFDPAGSAAAAQAASQPLDADLTAVAALTTTAYGRAFLALADAAAGRTALGLGTAATSASGDFQPADGDLTAIAALTTTAFGRSVLEAANAAALRTLAGLGTIATAAAGDYLPIGGGTVTGDIVVPDEAYDATAWNGSLEVPTKNAVRDKIETLSSGSGLPGFGFPYSVDPALAGSTFVYPTANRATYYRSLEGGTITKIGLTVVTSSGNISVGTNDNSGAGRAATPDAQTGTSGAVACPAAGWAEVALGGSVTVDAGDWLAISVDNSTASFRASAAAGSEFGTNLGLGRGALKTSAHPLPSPAGAMSSPRHGATIALIGVA